MEGYEQTPPEGLWEAVEAGIPVRRTAFPWMWALAGVAAVALAVVLLWRPESAPAGPALAEAEKVEIVTASDMDSSNSVAADAIPEPTVEAEHAVEAEPTVEAEPAAEVAPEANPAVEAQESPETTESPETPETPGVTESDVADKQFVTSFPSDPRPKSRPRLTASLVAGSVPGNITTTQAGYGIATAGVRSARMAPAALLSRNKPSETETRHSVALRVGAMFNLAFTEHWGVETGLQFTNLQTQTKSVSGSITAVKDKTVSYVGLPLLAVYTPFRLDRFSLYASAGPVFEYGFRSFGKDETYMGGERTAQVPFSGKESDFAFSLGLNIGAQWMVSTAGAIFVQPGLSWHMAGDGGLETFYTAHPLSFGVTAGVRFGF